MVRSAILKIYESSKTVLTLQDISLMLPDIPYGNLRRRLSYYTKSGHLKKLRRGIYAKDNYELFELANKIYTPSYISLETVLGAAGVTFQYYETIFAVSCLSRTLVVDGHTITYRKIKNGILTNKLGIEEQGNIIIASPERAFLDAVYLYKNYHFDKLDLLKWDKVMELKDLYQSRILTKRVKEYYQIYQEENA